MVTFWDFYVLQHHVLRTGLVFWTGSLLVLFGLLLRLVARKALGRFFLYGLEIKPDHVLITHGIYRWIRHPGYLGVIMFDLGTPLLFSSGYGLLLILLLIPMYIYRIRVEEQMLMERFGEEYRAYQRRTKKLIPAIY